MTEALDRLAAELTPAPDVNGPISAMAEEYAAWVRRTGLSAASAKVYTRWVRAFAAWADHVDGEYVECLTDPHVRDYAAKDYRRALLETRKMRPATVATAMAAVTSFMGWAGVGRPQGVGVVVPKQRKLGLPEDELRKVLRAARRRGPRDYAIVRMLYGTAVRVSELVHLDLDDVVITERTGILHVRFGKGGKPRDVGINQDTREALREWLAIRPPVEHPALFVGRGGRRLSDRGVERIFEILSTETGVKVTPHTLRHTHGKQHVDQGGSLVVLAENLGHADIRTTAIYAQPTSQDLVDATDAIRIDL